MLWVTVHNHCRVPPFGNLRVTGCLHLSVAYRSLPRPSSADIAKASTVRPYYLYLFCVIICAYRRRLTLDFALRTTSTRRLHLAQAPRYASNANENLMIEYMRDNIDMH